MKQKLRRFMAGFLAILTMFTTLFTNGTTAFAASSSANISFWYASAKDHGVISEFNSNHKGGILYAMIDGHSAYCMNFGLSAKGGQLMNSDSNPNTNLSAAQERSFLPIVCIMVIPQQRQKHRQMTSVINLLPPSPWYGLL